MRKINQLLALLIMPFFCTACSGGNVNAGPESSLTCVPTALSMTHEATVQTVEVTAGGEWTAYSDDKWVSCRTEGTTATRGIITVSAQANPDFAPRTATVVVKSGSIRTHIAVVQGAKPETEVDPTITVPQGYRLVWNDEFDSGTEPNSSRWIYETGHGENGWGNNEIQNYIAGSKDGVKCAIVSSGTLKIIAQKANNEVYSIRMNTKENWKYGWFEAKLKLPAGKGTWPAFWMLPDPFTSWPNGGEIDIMEEVGYDANRVHSTIHCGAYNGANGKQKGGNSIIPTAQSSFHVYAAEWTEDYIRFLIDGNEHFRYVNDKTGNATWPFGTYFNLKLNLAWGGTWGGAQGIDETALPATFEVEYVRVFQKK